MRVVDRKTFLALPAGTVYAKGVRWAFETLCVKGETTGNDWWYFDPTWVEANDTSEAIARLEEMERDGKSYPMETAVSRDGLYDEDAVFLIYEKEDLLRLLAFLPQPKA